MGIKEICIFYLFYDLFDKLFNDLLCVKYWGYNNDLYSYSGSCIEIIV